MTISDFPISLRLYVMSSLLILCVVSVAATGIWKMDKLGGQLEEIAQQDMPLIERLTKIAIAQLEQATWLERGLARVGTGAEADAERQFHDLGEEIDKELTSLIVELEAYQGNAQSEKLNVQVTGIIEELKSVHSLRDEYSQKATGLYEFIRAGDLPSARTSAADADKVQDVVNTKLVQGLVGFEAFTTSSARQAQNDEILGIKLLMSLTVAALVVGVLSAVIITRSIVPPVAGLTDAMRRLADNDTEVEIKYVSNRDEIGAMARALEIFKANALEIKRLNADKAAAEREQREERARLLAEVSDQIQQSIGGIAQRMASASEQVQSAARSLSSVSEQTSLQSNSVASASNQTSTNVQTVASAADELSASVQEISRQIAKSTEVTRNAVQKVEQANEEVTVLENAADEVTRVIDLINDIAGQTNLLALNATIEASRAGEAGKGFAVVATEVKSLASQTARATNDIAGQIQAMQAATKNAVRAIQAIGQVMSEIDEVSNGIAAAIEEQGAATQEIARNVEEAASGAHKVNDDIKQVAQATEENKLNATDLLSASETMHGDSANLKDHVSDLVNRLRAA